MREPNAGAAQFIEATDRLPNAVTQRALNDARTRTRLKNYSSVGKLFAALGCHRRSADSEAE